jgi:molybdopterin molybdotransferase
MRMASPALLPLEQAFAMVHDALGDMRVEVETLPVRGAQGRVLTADQCSRLDLPPFDKSAVDGYAILAGGVRDEYKLTATVAAGQPGGAELQPGTTVKVMTGAPVPAGAGKVVMVEHAEEVDGRMRIVQESAAHNICRRAEDMAEGQEVLKAGRRLGALEIANLIGCGVTEVPVARRVRLAIISTGDEIVDDPSELRQGRIMNTNGPLLAGLVAEHNLEVVSQTHVGDDREETKQVLRQALDAADIVVLSGGVSAGDFDFVPGVVSELGLTAHFERLAVKPGKPTLFATGNGSVLFGLPGNPVAVFLMFQLFVLRAALHLSGTRLKLRELSLPLAAGFRRRSHGRASYEPCCITTEGEVLAVEYHGSAHLTALLEADGCFVVPAGVATIAAGDRVDFLPLRMRWHDA